MNDILREGPLTLLSIDTRIVISVSLRPVAPVKEPEFEFMRLPDLAVRVVQRSTARVLWYYLRLEKRGDLRSIDSPAAIQMLTDQFDEFLALGFRHGTDPKDLVRSTDGDVPPEERNHMATRHPDQRLYRDLYNLLWPSHRARADLTGFPMRDGGIDQSEDPAMFMGGHHGHTVMLDLPRQCRLTIDKRNMQRRGQDNEIRGTIMLLDELREFTLGSTVHGMSLSEVIHEVNSPKLLGEIEIFLGAAWPFLTKHKLVGDPKWLP